MPTLVDEVRLSRFGGLWNGPVLLLAIPLNRTGSQDIVFSCSPDWYGSVGTLSFRMPQLRY